VNGFFGREGRCILQRVRHFVWTKKGVLGTVLKDRGKFEHVRHFVRHFLSIAFCEKVAGNRKWRRTNPLSYFPPPLSPIRDFLIGGSREYGKGKTPISLWKPSFWVHLETRTKRLWGYWEKVAETIFVRHFLFHPFDPFL
jgi:hypothetical protein